MTNSITKVDDDWSSGRLSNHDIILLQVVMDDVHRVKSDDSISSLLQDLSPR